MRTTFLNLRDRSGAGRRLAQGSLTLAAAACLASATQAQAAVPAPIPESQGRVVSLAPGQSVQAALDSAQPGDRITLKGGTYTGDIQTGAKGTASAPVTLTSAPGETATIAGAFKANGAAYLRVTRLKFDGQGVKGRWGTSLWNSDFVEMSYNEITNYPGIAQGILLKEGSDDAQLIGNRIHHVGGEWPSHEHGIYCDGATRPVMANNVIYDSIAGYGIHLFGNCDNALITNNTITTSQESGITIGGNSDRGTADNALITNNIIANNTTGSGTTGGWGITIFQPGAGNVVKDNLFSNNRSGDVNCPQCAVSGSRNVSPAFVNAAVHDYRLQPSSPAVSAASDQGLRADAEGKPRPQGAGPEMGAFELGDGTRASGQVAQPAAPATQGSGGARRASRNLALGKPATASSTRADTHARQGNDGHRGTEWASAVGKTRGQWWQVDLGKARKVRRVVVDWQGAYAKRYAVRVSRDGKRWRTAKTVRAGKARSRTARFKGRSARYVRIVTLRGAKTKAGVGFKEAKVYR